MSAQRVASSSRGGMDLRSHDDPPSSGLATEADHSSCRLPLVSSVPSTVMFASDETFRRRFLNVATAVNFPN
jgi:hypothetical protein